MMRSYRLPMPLLFCCLVPELICIVLKRIAVHVWLVVRYDCALSLMSGENLALAGGVQTPPVLLCRTREERSGRGEGRCVLLV